MTLEACMILLDNSNWARNGDYFPTRWDAQIDVAEKLAEQKILSNPESTVGLITMGGTKVDVLLTPAVKDRTKFVSALHDVQLKGKISFSNSLNIAQLTLKHRQNTNQRQRIVAFVASPVEEDTQSLEKIAKKLRKEEIAVDIILIGQREQSQVEKLAKFIETINKNNNSSFFEVPPSLDGSLLASLSTTGLFSEFGQDANANFGEEIDEELQRILKESEITAAQERQQREEQAKKEQPTQQQQQVQQPEQQPNDMEVEQNQSKEQQTMDQEENQSQQQNEQIVEKAREIATENQQNVSSTDNQDPNQVFQDPEFLEELLKETGINMDQEEISKVLQDNKDKKNDEKDNKNNKDK